MTEFKDYLIVIVIGFIILIFLASARSPSSNDKPADYPIDAGCHAGYNC